MRVCVCSNVCFSVWSHTSIQPPEWSSGLRHCIAVLAVPLEILVRVQAVSQQGRALETHRAAHNWPSVVRGREGFGPAGMSLSHRALATPVVGQVHAGLDGRQVNGVSSNTLVWLASGLSRHCLKKQCGLVGLCFGKRTALDLRLSRVHTGVAAMRPDCN